MTEQPIKTTEDQVEEQVTALNILKTDAQSTTKDYVP